MSSEIIMIGCSCSLNIRASIDALCSDGAGLISREGVQRGRLTRQETTN